MKPRRSQPPITKSETGESKRTRRRFIAFAVAIAFIAGAGIWIYTLTNQDGSGSAAAPAVQYVGQSMCASCHKAEAEKWSGSDHALAMQVANEQTVLGNFNDVRFTYPGVTSTFYKRDARFFVRTDGPDGELHDYEIAYVFGVRPLQQYLIAFPHGKLQPLGIAWDSRPQSEGGQRWFHLYPDLQITHTDPLHWTGRNQNWNDMCAACHSTNLQKNYDLANDTYATTWSEINVSCEACHGPGSKHVAWAEVRKAGSKSTDEQTKGLLGRFRGAGGGDWEITDPAQGSARWTGPPRLSVEVETCARCHARRRPITSTYEPDRPFLDTHMPALLDNGLYYADGQMLEEVYEYGSFTQSKMHREGVTCSDCHDPHSVKLLRGGGNATCTKCHQPSTFDTVEHHHHKPGTEAALCANCHMLQKNYMVVDTRRDHSFRVPRPDLSVAYGAPNACTQCHSEKSTQWAADAVTRWYGPNRRNEQHYATAIDAGRRGLAHAEKSLASVATDHQLSAIVRATALSLLPNYLSPASLPAIQAGVKDVDPLVRATAVHALEPLPPEDRLRFAVALLQDSVRAVRIEAARVLAGTPPELLSSPQRENLDRAIAELVAAEMVSAERPESHLSLSTLYTQMGRLGDAEASLRTALRLDPRFIPAMVNLADLYRGQSRDDAGEKLLRQAISMAPDSAEAIHSLGLLLVRQGRRQEAMKLLRQAAALQPDVARYSYAHGLALQASGDITGAISGLEQAHQHHPADREILLALVAMHRDRGNIQAAIRYAEKLLGLVPGDHATRATLEQLRRLGRAAP